MTDKFSDSGVANLPTADANLPPINEAENQVQKDTKSPISNLVIEAERKALTENSSSDYSVTPSKKYRGIDLEAAQASPLGQWFSNLPVNRKQVSALLTSQIISVLGIAGVGAVLIWITGHNQLTDQSKAEVTVTELNYMTKINQMGFGFRGQSDNAAIINTARLYKSKEPIPVGLRQQVKQILLGETLARKIEYATLVGTDKKIIVNANSSRLGITFDPNNLVSKVLETGYQYKASAIVPWAELKKENPLLPDGFEGKEALIRYTATPVKNPANKSIIGVLISGDIVNNKLPIVQETLKSFEGGYSAIYFRKPDGSFELATSLQQVGNKDQTVPNIPFPDTRLLESAVTNPGKKVTQQGVRINGATYSVSAMTLPDLWQQTVDGPLALNQEAPPTTILVRGTPETTLNNTLRNILLLQLGAVTVALLANGLLARLLGNAIVKPIEQLTEVTKRFAKGDRHIRANVLSNDEIGQLSSTFNLLADNITQSEQQKLAEARRKQWFADISQARDAEKLTVPFDGLLTEAREKIRADRMVIYRFLPDWGGYIAGESVRLGFSPALGDNYGDPCISQEILESYRQGNVVINNNVDIKGYHMDHVKLLKRLQVKSNLIIPIVQGEELFGLLIAHHCQSLHTWESDEINYLQQLAASLAQALAGLGLLERKQAESERIQAQNKQLQMELLQLLSDVEGATSGNLTVRADIGEGQIGIVADFFNAIIENLRDIVTQVKQTTAQVNASLDRDEGEVTQLAKESQKQAKKIQRMLSFIEEMVISIEGVARNAATAAQTAQNASKQASDGAVAMDQSVESIGNLRETVAVTAKKVKRLGEASQQISKVISLINEIALKTNLLAVNASIEAARAGEEGRGFAVVAEEVGQLAAQSTTATKEIEQIVSAIQKETFEVVEAMETGTLQVVEGTRLLEQAKRSLGEIVAESQEIDQLVKSISESTISQAKTSEMVSDFMKDIAKVSDDYSDTSRQVSESLKNTVEIAMKLQQSVDAFKVE